MSNAVISFDNFAKQEVLLFFIMSTRKSIPSEEMLKQANECVAKVEQLPEGAWENKALTYKGILKKRLVPLPWDATQRQTIRRQITKMGELLTQCQQGIKDGTYKGGKDAFEQAKEMVEKSKEHTDKLPPNNAKALQIKLEKMQQIVEQCGYISGQAKLIKLRNDVEKQCKTVEQKASKMDKKRPRKKKPALPAKPPMAPMAPMAPTKAKAPEAKAKAKAKSTKKPTKTIRSKAKKGKTVAPKVAVAPKAPAAAKAPVEPKAPAAPVAAAPPKAAAPPTAPLAPKPICPSCERPCVLFRSTCLACFKEGEFVAELDAFELQRQGLEEAFEQHGNSNPGLTEAYNQWVDIEDDYVRLSAVFLTPNGTKADYDKLAKLMMDMRPFFECLESMESIAEEDESMDSESGDMLGEEDQSTINQYDALRLEAFKQMGRVPLWYVHEDVLQAGRNEDWDALKTHVDKLAGIRKLYYVLGVPSHSPDADPIMTNSNAFVSDQAAQAWKQDAERSGVWERCFIETREC